MNKRICSLIVTMMLMFILSTSVFAVEATPSSDDTVSTYASNYFSGSTGTMNSLSGKESTVFDISSGSIVDNAKVSSVTLNVNVSSGSEAFYLNVKHPDGSVVQHNITGTGSKSVTLTQFNDKNPKGTWKVSITSTGTVSTATARMTVNYTY
ncbi:hypothetical protein ACIQXF_04925 [Lysinibacillus sp. NPDC097231]|uniref:hypothetical protein n=1 Tax=Lysinibacillus sp. NPDC097231 TaxID=3364142 RepID=UPI0037FC19C5